MGVPLLATIGAFFIPILLSIGNVVMRLMKGLHESTVSCYINPFLGIVMMCYMKYLGLDLSVFSYSSFHLFDWILITIFSVGTVGVQTLKFKAL